MYAMKKTILSSLFLYLGLTLQAEVVGISGLPLSRGWEYLRGDAGSPWEVFRPIPAPGKPETVPLWQSVTLPHCVNATDAVAPEVNYYQGPCWYRTVLSDSLLAYPGRLVLAFEGAGQVSDVYLFTQHVAHHTGGYDEWQADITEAARAFAREHPDHLKRFGGLPLAVRCDNSRRVEVIPSDMSDFNLYGGLYRPVQLLRVPDLHLEQLQVDASVDVKGKTGEVTVAWQLASCQALAGVRLSLIDASGRVCAQQRVAASSLVSGRGEARLTLSRPHLWDVTDPYLYQCEVAWTDQAGNEQKTVRKIGFRQFRFEEKGPFYLNGRRLLLQGVHRHEDHAGVGAALTDSMMTAEMVQMHQMGVNFIRLGHYQQSSRILDLCDSLGVLVWEEIPWCRGGVGGPSYRKQAQDMLSNMIRQHRHHPSILLWGMGNEIDWPGDFPTFEQDSIRAFLTTLVEQSHRQDPSRPTSLRRCDFARDIVDVYSPSIWAGWYSGKFTDFAQMEKKGFDSVPRFLHVEWGADSHVGRHLELSVEQQQQTVRGDANGEWDETYAALLFDWTLKEQTQMPWLTGTAIWTFKDFSTPLRPTNPLPYMNQKGLVQRDGTPKEAFYVVQSYWSQTPMVHIYGHSWPIRWGQPDEEKPVWVYSNCPAVELYLDGQSLGRRHRNVSDFPAAGLHWQTPLPTDRPYELVAVGFDKKGHECSRDTLSQRYEARAWGEPAAVELRVITLQGGRQAVEAQVVDAAGVPCLDCKDVMEWGCTDPTRLLINQGTATGSRILEASNGRATIEVLPGHMSVFVGVQLRSRNISASIQL